MIVDANILLHSVDERSPHHQRAAAWVTRALNGGQRIGLPWQTLGAFVRLSTNPRVSPTPLTAVAAMGHVTRWLEADPAWVPPATERTVTVFRDLILRHQITGHLVTDAQLAALALEHAVPVVSGDSDFARFPEVRWINPLVGG